MSRRAVTLRRKLITWLLALLISLWIITSVATYFISVQFANVAYDHALTDTLLSLAAEVEVKDGIVTLDLPPAARKILEFDEHDTVYYKVYQDDGDRQGRLLMGREDVPEPPMETIGGDKPVFSDGLMDGKKIRLASLYIPYNGGYVVVQVGETLIKRWLAANQILSTIVLPQLLLIILAAIAVWFGVSRGLMPLSRLQQAVASRSPRDLRPVPEEDAPQEVRLLVRSINTLLDRLSKALATQRRFIADAAHELRTPLAGLKTQIELALRESDAEKARQTLFQLRGGVEHGAHLANQLLALAKAEHYAERTLVPKPIDLGMLVRRVTRDWVPWALEKRIDLGFDGDTVPTLVLGDELLLKEMLMNLIDNAIRYTPAGGVVTTRVQGDEASVELAVEDSGRGIEPHERERVFEPFYRVLGAGAEGCGLGLAIVREIALVHGAHCSLGAGGGDRGVIVRIRFPSAAAKVAVVPPLKQADVTGREAVDGEHR